MAPQQIQWLMVPWLLLVAWVQPSYSYGLYAFATDRTTQVGIQDPSTGKIYYSSCNSEDTPIFPLDEPNVLDTENTPRNGTALAGAGWWDTEKIIASIFWQAKDGVIVNGYYECNMTTGKLKLNGEYTISLTAEIESVHKESGLAVDLLGGGDDGGYRVFYHNEDRQIKMLSYTDDTNWIDGGTVSQDTAEGMAIGTVWYGDKNMTVAYPKGTDNVETTRLQKTGNWSLAAFPQELAGKYTNNTGPSKIRMNSKAADWSLPGWNSSIEAIGMATDRSQTRSLFYLGDDKVLREAIAIKNDWQMAPNRSETIWPLSDDPSAGLAVAYHQGKGMTWIYYYSNDSIIQAHKNASNEWEDAIALPQTLPKNETDSGSKGKDKPSNQEDSKTESTGLTGGAKAGIAIGVIAGVLAVGALIFFFVRRRRNKQVPPKEAPPVEAGGTPVTPVAYPAPQYEKDTTRAGDPTSPSEMGGDARPAELDNPSVVYELPGNHTR
ncbi:hypothetical protein FGRMN_7558 [Fusarium graminum]|nr:hypothetical protein FGRMN_7558 [Fusarium graminum]